MIVEEEIIGSHTEDESHEDDINMEEIMSEFGIEQEEGEKADPPIDKPEPEKAEEKKGITVKFNKEETFIEEDKIPEYARKGLNYDKVEGRAKELQASLDRAARLAGFTDHTEFVANLDKIEQHQQQKEKDAYSQLRSELRAEAEENGLDPDKVEAYLDNHPLMKEAKKALEERDASLAEKETLEQQQAVQAKWQELYDAYPELVEDAAAWSKGERPTFYTEEMERLWNEGNSPLLIYEHLNRDAIREKAKKATEQKLIKEQQLGLRSKVEGHSPSDKDPSVPADLASAFAAFGLPESDAKKYVK